MTILAAEDDPLILMTIEAYFTREGYQVITASNRRDALRRIEECCPDIIITDVMMPFYSGHEIVGRIKNGLYKKVPVIVLSAMSQEAAKKEAFDLGADDYITKPFSLAELSLRIQRLVNINVMTDELQLKENY
jgi:DNA-binding response OmpR family regulator